VSGADGGSFSGRCYSCSRGDGWRCTCLLCPGLMNGRRGEWRLLEMPRCTLSASGGWEIQFFSWLIFVIATWPDWSSIGKCLREWPGLGRTWLKRWEQDSTFISPDG